MTTEIAIDVKMTQEQPIKTTSPYVILTTDCFSHETTLVTNGLSLRMEVTIAGREMRTIDTMMKGVTAGVFNGRLFMLG